MSRLFIERPIFAWVLAIIVMLAGVGAISKLPIEQYPDIAPTTVNIRASYPGASAETIENSVASRCLNGATSGAVTPLLAHARICHWFTRSV